MLTSIIIAVVEWLLEKIFAIVGKDLAEWRAAKESTKSAKIAAKQYELDKAAAKTDKESIDAGKNMLNS